MTQLQALISSNAIPVTVDHRVRLTIFSGIAGAVAINVYVRQLDANGVPIETPFTFSAPGNFAQTIKTIQLTKGQLISVAVQSDDVPQDEGLIYVRVDLQRATLANASTTYYLTSGYLSLNDIVQWPDVPPQAPDAINGAVQTFTPADPAAGAEIDWTPTGVAYTQLIAGSIQFDTSVAVALRRVTVSINNATGTILTIASRTTQAAGLSYIYWLWSSANTPADAAPNIYIPVPQLPPLTDFELKTLTDNIDAADQFSNQLYLASQRTNTA